MTAQKFLEWLNNTKNCDSMPMEGRNLTGLSIKILCKQTGRGYYFSGPFGHVELTESEIKEICDELWISYPPGIT